MRIKHTFKHKLGSLGDIGSEWYTEEDWQRHREYVEDVKKSGDYLKEVDVSYDLEYFPQLDDSNVVFGSKDGKQTAQFLIFDVSEESKIQILANG
jgi:hypothetical protein